MGLKPAVPEDMVREVAQQPDIGGIRARVRVKGAFQLLRREVQ